ncbi:MAG: 7-carboxy-7-deazaguanine synthase QueE [Verrucomicrobiae bacterium]|nr:7-carboxy-7-deazaguanine synthase QueE [Verrucomicrobiae bacterium]
MAETLIVNEIFYSIQGESTYAGLPCVFVRLTGCNLRCIWCDTQFAFSEGTEMTVEQVLAKVTEFCCQLVEVTGGEPLLQPAVHTLMRRLCDLGHTVLLETNGAEDISTVDPRVIRIMDIKCPSSGESDKNRYSNLRHLTAKDELKFVIADRPDYEWAKQQLHQHKLSDRCVILFSPVWQRLPLKTLAEWILTDHLPVRLQAQWHKYIWGPEARSV